MSTTAHILKLESPKLPRIARIAAIFALLFCAITLVGAITSAPMAFIVAMIPLAAGIGILRRLTWSAYGFALYLTAQVPLTAVWIIRNQSNAMSTASTAALMIFNLSFIVLFFFAGRAMARAGARTGHPVLWTLLSVVTAAVFIIYQPFVIPTGNMENTLLIGDRILVQRFPKPVFNRDQMVVFSYPVDRKQTYVKRIIGVSGDRIRIVNKALIRNGAPVSEPYVSHRTDYIDSYRDNFPSEATFPLGVAAQQMLANNIVNGEVLVPPRQYFVLGDNRDSSYDSRYFGFVTAGDLLGKPALIYDSQLPTEQDGFKKSIGWSTTRWKRLFRPL